MRPPSYYASIVKSNSGQASPYGGSSLAYSPSSDYSSARTSSRELRSGLASASSASYVSRSHLPFVGQSTLVAHCIAGVGSSTRPYGGSSAPASSARGYLSRAGTSGSSAYSSSALSSYGSRPASTKRSASQYGTSSASSGLGSGSGGYSSPYLSPASSGRFDASSRPAATHSTSSYYKPIRLRERPLLTQISRQLHRSSRPSATATAAAASARTRAANDQQASATTSHSTSRDERANDASERTDSERRARTRIGPAPASGAHATESADSPGETTAEIADAAAAAAATAGATAAPVGQDESSWSSDIGRNISRNKYLIKFREFDKHSRPSVDVEATIQLPTADAARERDACVPDRNTTPPPEPRADLVVEHTMRLPTPEPPRPAPAASHERAAAEPKCDSDRLGPGAHAGPASSPSPTAPEAKRERKNVKLKLKPIGAKKKKADASAEATTSTTVTAASDPRKCEPEPEPKATPKASREATKVDEPKAAAAAAAPAAKTTTTTMLECPEEHQPQSQSQPPSSSSRTPLPVPESGASVRPARPAAEKRPLRASAAREKSSEENKENSTTATATTTTTTTPKTTASLGARVGQDKESPSGPGVGAPATKARRGSKPAPAHDEPKQTDAPAPAGADEQKVAKTKVVVKTKKKKKKLADEESAAPPSTPISARDSARKASSEVAADELAEAAAAATPPSEKANARAAGQAGALAPAPKRPPGRIRFREYNINDFNFLTVLGHGGWGFVILAELKEHDACFAVKCIKKITIVEDDDYDSIMIERKVLTLGNIHPFICKLFCTFETPGYLFFVMEYCAGGDLMFHVQHEGKFSEPRCRFYAAEIICAIRFLHNRHIIYRDLKLDNILLDARGHIRLVDFGMCQCRTYREEMLPSNFCGTPEYISPEIIKGVPYNHSVDWWSFGVLLYEMAVGKMPFRGNDENELLWNVCYEQIHYPMFLTKELTSLLKSLLEREPDKRMGMATCKAGDIYEQPFFRGVDWKAMEELRVEPPFVPEVRSDRDVSNFDSDFTESTCELSPVDEGTLARIDQKQFEKFPYTNPDIFIFDPTQQSGPAQQSGARSRAIF